MRTSRVMLVSVTVVVLFATVGVLRPSSGGATTKKAYPRTIISLEFDDGNLQQDVGPILKAHGMHGAFYINSGYVGTGGGYSPGSSSTQLAADGNEIAGHTLTHRDLPTLSPDEQAREICSDRKNLILHGFRPWTSRIPSVRGTPRPSHRPHVRLPERPARVGPVGVGLRVDAAALPLRRGPDNIPDRWAILTADAPIDLTYLIEPAAGRHERRAARRWLGPDFLAPHLSRRLRRVLVAPAPARPVPDVAGRASLGRHRRRRRPSRCCTSSGTGSRRNWPRRTSRRPRRRPPAQQAAEPGPRARGPRHRRARVLGAVRRRGLVAGLGRVRRGRTGGDRRRARRLRGDRAAAGPG